MNNYTLLFNHTENNTGLIIEAHDMQHARELATEEVRAGWTITAIKCEGGNVYPFKAQILNTVTGSTLYDLIGFIVSCEADGTPTTTAATLINAKMTEDAATRQAYRAGLIESLTQLHNGYNLDVTRYAAEVLVLIL